MKDDEIDTVIAKALADAPLIFNSQELAAFIRMRLRAHGLEVVSVEATEAMLLAFMHELHSNVPEDERPMARSDFSDEQWGRIEAAYKAMMRAK